jgi:hypothetical protein
MSRHKLPHAIVAVAVGIASRKIGICGETQPRCSAIEKAPPVDDTIEIKTLPDEAPIMMIRTRR